MMFDLLRLLADVWLILMVIAAFAFIIQDFDWPRFLTQRAEWISLVLMVPAIAWAGWLALASLIGRFAVVM